jgi:hypothetical protein
MDSRISLATQVLILLTAVVGLYKVIKERRSPSTSTSEQAAPARSRGGKGGTWEFVREFGGIYAAVLVPLLAMVAFSGLLHLMQSFEAKPAPAQRTTFDRSNLNDAGRAAYTMTQVALSVAEVNDRQELLSLSTTVAIEAGALNVAELAASGMEPSAKDEALLRVIRACIQSGPQADDVAVSAVRDMNEWRQGRAARELIDGIQRRIAQAVPDRKSGAQDREK